jgi:hypothetical protein
MKKKRGAKRSSTQSSNDSGKAFKKLRLKRVEKQLQDVQEKASYLLKALAEGGLPEGLIVQNLIRSQRANANEIAEIKGFVAQKMRAVEKLQGIPEQLARLQTSMLDCLDKLRELSRAFKDKERKTWKQRKRIRQPPD